MSQDYAPLALDDLVHIMSPSPVPFPLPDDSDVPPPTKSASPEPLPEPDIVQMRTRVVQIGKYDDQLNRREKELAEMVLSLTAVVRPDPDQLLRQAEMISALTQQRDLLLYQAEEQRLRWNSEKDGWARMAEALLAQQAKNRPNSERDEDFDRLQAAETDNKGLRQRLHETQSRLQMLESELTRLKPLLLMQPLISRSSMPPPTPNPKTQHARRRKKDATATEDEEHGASEDDGPADPLDTPSHTPSHTSHSQTTPKAKSRKSEAPTLIHPLTHPHKRRPSQKAISRGLSADARAEHLLLAARKIGKQRAGIMAGMVHHLEEQEREQRREESAVTAVATTPKTPKRNAPHAGYPTENGYVYLNGQMRPAPGMQPVPLFFPAYSHHLLQTPSSSTTAPSVTSSTSQSAQKAKQDARTNNPQTPLDSLLSAARSMLHEDDVDESEEVDVVGDSPAKTSSTRLAQPRDMLGSPVPKRRKVAARIDKPITQDDLSSRSTEKATTSSATANAGVGRIRSALDVLADQAAVFSSQEQPAPAFQPQAQTRGKGKGRTGTQSQEPSGSMPKQRAKTKSRTKEADADTPVFAAPISRSTTPQSNAGDNLTSSAGTIHPCAEGESGTTIDPGGGTNNADTTTPSSQPLDSMSAAEIIHPITSNDETIPRSQEAPPDVDEASDLTPRQGYRAPDHSGAGVLDATGVAMAQPIFALPTPLEADRPDASSSSSPQPSETVLSGGEHGEGASSIPATVAAQSKNKERVRVAEQDAPPATKRQRSPYVKWSKEEDDLLAQAVAKYGQKWDLVQKALPSRGYHQVRQRWLRKLGVFDSKPDLSSFQTAATSSAYGDGAEPRGNPKLGLAPLSSERAFSVVGRPPSLPS